MTNPPSKFDITVALFFFVSIVFCVIGGLVMFLQTQNITLLGVALAAWFIYYSVWGKKRPPTNTNE